MLRLSSSAPAAPPRTGAGRQCVQTLRRLAGEGVRVGGISGGPYVLAEAGLLKGRRFTIHWEHAPALAEAFPDLRPEQARFVIDGARITCGGGVAPLDLMHALIAERMGADFARRVSDWFLHTQVAPGAGSAARLARGALLGPPSGAAYGSGENGGDA